MKFLKNTLASILMVSTLSTAGTFEQGGVKEGNDRVSIGLYTTLHNDNGADASATLYGQYGKFLTDDIEVLLDVFTATTGAQQSDDTDIVYMVGPGINYYFAKAPTLTPYVGTQIFYSDKITDDDGDFDAHGSKYYVGFHKFLNENASVTPELSVQLFDFTEYSSTNLNVYLTYFFN
jgi:hypothetical protein